jgi:hypothetical protein
LARLCRLHEALKDHLDRKTDAEDAGRKAVLREIETLLYLFSHAARVGQIRCLESTLKSMLPLVLMAEEETNKEFLALNRHCLQLLSTAVRPAVAADCLLALAIDHAHNSRSWRVRLAALEYVRECTHRLLLRPAEYQYATDAIDRTLSDGTVEIRELGCLSLAGLLRMASPAQIRTLLSRAPRQLRKRGGAKAPMDSEMIRLAHAGVLAIAAVIRSQPTELPEWMADAITIMSEFECDDALIKATIISTMVCLQRRPSLPPCFAASRKYRLLTPSWRLSLGRRRVRSVHHPYNMQRQRRASSASRTRRTGRKSSRHSRRCPPNHHTHTHPLDSAAHDPQGLKARPLLLVEAADKNLQCLALCSNKWKP